MNKNINAEIEQMAENLSKSVTDPKEKLFNVIKSLGAQGLKDKMANLSDEDRVILKAALEEMSLQKAVSFDTEAAGAKVIQGKLIDTVIQEEIGNDDADEKLVKPEANVQHPQGTPTEGWSGQVIKGLTEQEALDCFDNDIEKAQDGFKKLEGKLKEKGAEDAAGLAANIGRKKYGKAAFDKKISEGEKGKMKKSEIVEQVEASEDLLVQVVGSLIQKGMKEKDVADKCESKGMDKKKVMGAIDKFKKKQGNQKAPGEFDDGEIEKAKTKILAEEDQVGSTDQMTEESKNLDDNTQSPAKANKKTQDDVNNTKKIEKSVSWGDANSLLKANTGGRNFHFNTEQFVVETLSKSIKEDIEENKQKDKKPKKDEKETDKKEMKKSEQSDDINDLIAKSLDRNWGDLEHSRQMEANAKAQNGTLVKSFDDVKDLAAIYGISEEIARKIIEGK